MLRILWYFFLFLIITFSVKHRGENDKCKPSFLQGVYTLIIKIYEGFQTASGNTYNDFFSFLYTNLQHLCTKIICLVIPFSMDFFKYHTLNGYFTKSHDKEGKCRKQLHSLSQGFSSMASGWLMIHCGQPSCALVHFSRTSCLSLPEANSIRSPQV